MEVRPEGTEAILIVDDDELVRKSAATLIASLGYRLRPELKVLFTSGYFEYVEIRHALDPSIEQVSKPYERDVLAAILRRTLSGRGGVADDRRSDAEER